MHINTMTLNDNYDPVIHKSRSLHLGTCMVNVIIEIFKEVITQNKFTVLNI